MGFALVEGNTMHWTLYRKRLINHTWQKTDVGF